MNTELKNQIREELINKFKKYFFNVLGCEMYTTDPIEIKEELIRCLFSHCIYTAYALKRNKRYIPRCKNIKEIFNINITTQNKEMKKFFSSIECKDLYSAFMFLDSLAEEYYTQHIKETHKLLSYYITSNDLNNHILTYFI